MFQRLYPIKVKEGEDAVYQLTLVNVDGSVYGLSEQQEMKAEVRDAAGQIILEMIASIENAENGTVNLSIKSDRTIGKAGSYWWDLRIDGESIDFLDTSRFSIIKAITRLN